MNDHLSLVIETADAIAPYLTVAKAEARLYTLGAVLGMEECGLIINVDLPRPDADTLEERMQRNLAAVRAAWKEVLEE